MYSLPSEPHMREPRPRTIIRGSAPTARNARTGEFTPPGMSCSARFWSLRDLSVLRAMASRLTYGISIACQLVALWKSTSADGDALLHRFRDFTNYSTRRKHPETNFY